MDVQGGEPFGVVSSLWAHGPTTARAKAFAAMLLMPADAVRDMARAAGGIDAALVGAIMRRFGTGLSATTWHLYHLRLISDEARLALAQRVQADLES